MKTAISIPDDVYAEAEHLTQRLKKSRSQLYTDALREYLARHDPDAVTETLDRLCEQLAPRAEPDLAELGRSLLARVEW
jgi:metal-responsive CopG/Arc/MetJ family transcriptional regulator